MAIKMLLVLLTAAIAAVPARGAGLRHQRNPFAHLASELQHKKVVGLGDFAHQNAYPFHTVMLVLSNWVEVASATGGRLTLALEADAQMAAVLNRYLETGELEPVLDFWLPFSSLDQLEFYGKLRDFALRIRALNQGRPSDRQVRFRVLGLEPPSPLSATNITAEELPSVAQAGAVANERDRRVADTLLAYLKQHPQERVLAFYGDAHLCLRRTSRSWATRIFGSTETWRPLGLLLKEQLGSDFLSVAQERFPPSARHADSPHRALTAQNILVEAADIPWESARFERGDHDAVVFFTATTIDEAHLLKYICSRRILDRALERVAFLAGLPQNAFTARHSVFSSTLAGLRLTSGKSFESAPQWKAWAATNAYDGFVRMDSDDFAEAVLQACNQKRSEQRNVMLASLGLPPTLAFREPKITPEQWREVWPNLRPTVRFLQCLGTSWAGYPDEQARAREYLVKFSGKELPAPPLYLRWYRQSRLGLNY